MANGVRARVATRTFTAVTADGPRPYDRGAIIVPALSQDVDRTALDELLRPHASDDAIEIAALTGGLTP